MRTPTSSAAHCSVMSGKLVTKQAAGRDMTNAAGCLLGGAVSQGSRGGGDWQTTAGGVATRLRLIAKLRNSGSALCVVALLLESNRALLIRCVVYLYRWRRGVFLIERLSGIDEGADGLWPLVWLYSAAKVEN